MLKLLALDIDGTLMPEGATAIDSSVFPILEDIINSGIDIITCSGRQYANQRKLFAPIADKIDYLCENGSLIIHKGEIISRTVLDKEKIFELMRVIIAQDGCEVLLSTPEKSYIQPKNKLFANFVREVVGNVVEETEDICSVSGDFIKVSAYYPEGDFQAMQKRLEEYSLPYQKAVSGGNRWIDFLTEGSNKGTALEKYCMIRGIDKADCVAVGDNENDLSLIGKAGQVWAMKSGKQALKEKADRIINSVPEELLKILNG